MTSTNVLASIYADAPRARAAAEADALRVATGSTAATVRHERRMPNGELVVEAEATARVPLSEFLAGRMACAECGTRPSGHGHFGAYCAVCVEVDC